MRKSDQTIAVLSRFRGPQKRAAWLRIAIWIVAVFSVALGRNIARGTCVWRGRDSFGVNHKLA